MALIDCPECDAQVSTAAVSCPKCGFPIAESVRNALGKTEKPKPTKKPMSMGRRAVIAFCVALTLLYFFASDGDRAAERGSAPTSSAPARQDHRQPVISVQLSQLVKECKANQVAFEEKWKRKTVRFRGVVKEIDAGFRGGSLRLRKPGSRYDSISASGIPRDTLAMLTKGEEVTLKCERVFEVLGSPSFADCTLPYR